MSMLDKLSRLVSGATASATREATAALAEAYLDCGRRAAQLARHAEMSPQAYSTEALKELAAAEEEQHTRLRQALEAAGAPVPSPALPEPVLRGALNHWARLVRDLESHQVAVQRFRQWTMRFAETLPQTAGLFETLCREEIAHCEDLRALIARADPQALD